MRRGRPRPPSKWWRRKAPAPTGRGAEIHRLQRPRRHFAGRHTGAPWAPILPSGTLRPALHWRRVPAPPARRNAGRESGATRLPGTEEVAGLRRRAGASSGACCGPSSPGRDGRKYATEGRRRSRHAGGGTTRAGTGLRWMTPKAVDPSSSPLILPSPLEPTTIRSASRSSAKLTRACTGERNRHGLHELAGVTTAVDDLAHAQLAGCTRLFPPELLLGGAPRRVVRRQAGRDYDAALRLPGHHRGRVDGRLRGLPSRRNRR